MFSEDGSISLRPLGTKISINLRVFVPPPSFVFIKVQEVQERFNGVQETFEGLSPSIFNILQYLTKFYFF